MRIQTPRLILIAEIATAFFAAGLIYLIIIGVLAAWKAVL